MPNTQNPTRKQILTDLTSKYMTSTTERDREDFKEAYLKHVSAQVNSLYIDLPMLVDVYLGGLLLMTQDNPQAFDHIVRSMPIYNNRMYVEHASCFPDLNITEDQLLAYITDPANATELILKSPPTSFWNPLKTIDIEIRQENSAVEHVAGLAPEKLRYILNLYPLSASKDTAKWLKLKLIMGLETKQIQFGVLSTDSANMENEVYTTNQYFFLYHFNSWVNDSTSKAYQHFIAQDFIKAKLRARPYFDDHAAVETFYTLSRKDILELEKKNLMIVNTYAEFQYYRPTVTVFDEHRKQLEHQDVQSDEVTL